MAQESAKPLAVAIDTASDLAGVALTQDGVFVAETTWRTRQNHSRELLPTLDWLLTHTGHSKDEIGAIFVCLGPGSYAGLRVGLSTAKALAFGLGASIAGVGRLEADALHAAQVSGRRVVAVHAAGRAELAWGAYEKDGERLREVVAPRLDPKESLLTTVQPDDIVCGELTTMDEKLRAGLADKGATLIETSTPRVVAVARLGQQRLDRGEVDNADTLVPLYLRAPAIGPQGTGARA